jgi:hypothetical protein
MMFALDHIAHLLRRAARRASAENGDTLLEVIVGAALGLIVVGGLAVAFAKGNDSSLGSQRETTLIEAANQEMQVIRQDVKVNGFSALGMQSAPPAASSASLKYDSATPLDPDSFVTTCSGTQEYEIENNYDNTAGGLVSSLPTESPCTTAGEEPLLTDTSLGIANGFVPTNPQIVTAGSMTIDLYEFVTQTNVGCNTSYGGCGTDARRVVVAAVDSQAAAACSSAVASKDRCVIGADAPVYVTTIFTNPVPTNSPDSSVGITLGLQTG